MTNDNNQKEQENMIVWTAETRQRENIASLNHLLQLIAPEKTLLDSHFVQGSDVVPFLDTIEALAPTVGAQAQIDSVGAGVGNAGLVVGLTASGSFEALYKFLTLLENSPYQLDFLSMDMHSLSVPDASGKIVANLGWQAVFKIQLLTLVP